MLERRDEAYVLQTHELGDADLIVTLLTRDHGRVRAVARSARRSRRRFGGNLESLSHVQAAWTEKQGRDLHRLDSVEGLTSHAEMQSEPVCQAACAVLAELSDAFGSDGQRDPAAFRLLGAVLEGFASGGDPWTLIRYFEFWTLKVHGLMPSLSDCATCGTPVPDVRPRVSVGRGVLCRSCHPAPGAVVRILSPEDLAFLDAVRRLSPKALGTRRVPSQGGGLELLLRGTLESYLERSVRSYRHLRAVSSPIGEGTG